MSRRKTPARDWQAEIYARHQHWIARKASHMAVSDGWADVIARLFDRIERALAGERRQRLAFWGRLGRMQRSPGFA